MKKITMSFAGLIGAYVAALYGGWTQSMTTLAVFMGVDWISGLICAGIFKSSDKTDTGGLSSKVGFRGLGKKCMIMLFVLVGARLDMTLGTTYLRDAVCIAFIANELLSIVENAGAMGLPIPKVIAQSVELLQSRSKSDGDRDDKNNA